MNQRFEDYIKDYNSNFSEISKCANSKGIVAKYYSSTKGRYKKFFDEKDNFDIEKFAIRYRHSGLKKCPHALNSYGNLKLSMEMVVFIDLDVCCDLYI